MLSIWIWNQIFRQLLNIFEIRPRFSSSNWRDKREASPWIQMMSAAIQSSSCFIWGMKMIARHSENEGVSLFTKFVLVWIQLVDFSDLLKKSSSKKKTALYNFYLKILPIVPAVSHLHKWDPDSVAKPIINETILKDLN